MYVFRMAPGKTLPETAKAAPIRPKVYIYIILQLPVPGVKWKPGSGKRETVISHRGAGGGQWWNSLMPVNAMTMP